MSALLCRARSSSALLRSSSALLQPRIAASALPFSLSHTHGGVAHPEGETIALTGRQYEMALMGNFPDAPRVQPFGTMAQPAIIYSGKKSRIVGCIGGGAYTHRLQWFTLKEGPKHVCSHCGQVFKLITDNNYEENKHLVDQKTREHYEYYKTLAVKLEQQAKEGKVVAANIEVGPHSKY